MKVGPSDTMAVDAVVRKKVGSELEPASSGAVVLVTVIGTPTALFPSSGLDVGLAPLFLLLATPATISTMTITPNARDESGFQCF